ncbi:hypothetical protein [Levilactobacillus brevis]|mgnify:CR=1 FL=1|uniref:hypothetical protein n=1 Tax=Levilactobacillus brevis TaxID=1580 RepID=UPI000BEA997A|nr:hypothetical protein [Levilactobacillus brevis]MBT9677684.1 hypothetical protein [Levilactobacillus brevis]MCZ2119282.1 hypothetical protein [Levilactobacillus brevis]MCZ2124770.1 hypothetical protein [Levilactobacillus brevis]MCZ2209051.1 hypothetical protein [Levilactobacillus brevis]MCZ2324554.1 hypothetical protein [Levilactobacillus brevis]
MSIETAHDSIVLWENKAVELQDHIDDLCIILESHDDPEIEKMVHRAMQEKARYNKKIQRAQNELDSAIGSILSGIN